MREGRHGREGGGREKGRDGREKSGEWTRRRRGESRPHGHW